MRNAMLLVAGVFFLHGCASITGTPNQNISVQTKEQNGGEVIGASCELTNNKGKWFVTTPGSVGIHRSNDDLHVLCNKDRYAPGRAAVVSETKGAMFGNIILGGGIGAIVDHSSGAAYEYPSFVQVVMGILSKAEVPKEQTSQNTPPANGESIQAPATQNPQRSDGQELTAQTLPQSPEEKLRELKRLFDAGLVSKETYTDQQRAVLSR